jgi:ABC-2 type transport system permease protein
LLNSVVAMLSLLPVLLTAGNFLSLVFPVKFHASLKRRDKLPFIASMLGVIGVSFALRRKVLVDQ